MNEWKCNACYMSDPCYLKLEEYGCTPSFCPFGNESSKWVKNEIIEDGLDKAMRVNLNVDPGRIVHTK